MIFRVEFPVGIAWQDKLETHAPAGPIMWFSVAMIVPKFFATTKTAVLI
jgi:hypothetical protein